MIKTCRLSFFNTKISYKSFLYTIRPKKTLKILPCRSILIRTKTMPVKNHHYNGKAVQIPMLLGNNYKTLFLVIGLCMWGKYWLVVPADHFHNKVQNANALWKTVIDSVPSWLYAYWYQGCLSNLKTKYNTESHLLSQLPQIYYLMHTYLLRLRPELCYPKCLSGLETSNRRSWRL